MTRRFPARRRRAGRPAALYAGADHPDVPDSRLQ